MCELGASLWQLCHRRLGRPREIQGTTGHSCSNIIRATSLLQNWAHFSKSLRAIFVQRTIVFIPRNISGAIGMKQVNINHKNHTLAGKQTNVSLLSAFHSCSEDILVRVKLALQDKVF